MPKIWVGPDDAKRRKKWGWSKPSQIIISQNKSNNALNSSGRRKQHGRRLSQHFAWTVAWTFWFKSGVNCSRLTGLSNGQHEQSVFCLWYMINESEEWSSQWIFQFKQLERRNLKLRDRRNYSREKPLPAGKLNTFKKKPFSYYTF